MEILGLIIGAVVVVSWLLAPIALIVIGLRGRPVWSSPSCAKCGYDLRARKPDETAECPECGADLTGPRGVRFARPSRLHRSWGLVIFALVILALPLAAVLGGFLFQRYSVSSGSPMALANATVDEVVTAVDDSPDEPWAWRELETRIQTGEMSQAQVEAAVDALTSHFKAERAAGRSVHLSWQAGFVDLAISKNLVSDEKLEELGKVFYGPVMLESLERVEHKGKKFSFRLRSDGHGDMGSYRLLTDVARVTAGEESLKLSDIHRSFQLSGYAERPSTTGRHVIQFEVVRALMSPLNMTGLSHDAPMEDWPPAVVVWRETVEAKLDVLAPGQIVVKTTEDPKLDPQNAIAVPALSVKEVVATRKGDKVTLAAKIDVRQNSLSVAVSGDVVFVIDGKRHPARGYATYQHGGRLTSRGGGPKVVVDKFDPQVTSLDVRIEANPRHVNEWQLVETSWGGDIVFEDVPIRRLDLAEPVAAD